MGHGLCLPFPFLSVQVPWLTDILREVSFCGMLNGCSGSEDPLAHVRELFPCCGTALL